MSMTLDQIEAAALQLPEVDRVRLIDALYASLDALEVDEEAWRAEIMRRADEMDSGEEAGIPIDQVFAELRDELAAMHAPRP